MRSSNISKIERVFCPKSPDIWVDLCLNKERGLFFARVGQETIEEEKKVDAVRKTQEALTRLYVTEWVPVILIRTIERDKTDDAGTENNMPNFQASCEFSYMRRERAQNPLKPKERIERMHTADFEEAVKDKRKWEASFTLGADRKTRVEEVEATMRQERAANSHVHTVYDWGERERHYGGGRKRKEYELPYSEEAWAGIQRIAYALRETQQRLDEFAAKATPKTLAALGASSGPLLLLPQKEP